MRGFYRNIKHLLCAIFVFCTVVFASNFANAEYICDSKIIYDLCESGYYMTYKDVYNGTPRAGNACTACPSGWTCSGGTSAPTRTITLNKNGGSGTINGTSGTISAIKTCTYGSICSFGSASGLRQTGYKFTGGWGTGSSCTATATSFTNPSSSTYYACKTDAPVYTITLDSKYYATSSTTTGTAVTTNAAPTPIYVKYNTDWYTNSNTTTYFVNLSTLPAYTGYTFGGFYTGKAGTGNQIIDASGKIVKGYTTAFTKNTTLYAKWTIKSVTCPAGNYLKAGGTTTSDCVKCPKATTYSGAYCPGGTFNYNASSNQGLNACPVLNDSTRMQSSSYPNNDDGGAATMISSNISAWFEGQDDISDCMVSYTFSNSAGNFTLEGTHYNSSTGRYDNGGGKYYTTLQPGYYLTTKYSDTYCDTSVSNYATRKKLYRIAKKCSAGSYCPGYASAMPLCSSTNETYGTNMGINTCPTNSSSTAGATLCTCNTGYSSNGGAPTTTTNACVANTYTVSYKCFGPPFMSGALAAYNNSFTLSVPSSCVKAGYTLTGWTTTDDSGNNVEYGTTDTFVWKYLDDKTFNAVWTPNTYTVTLDPDLDKIGRFLHEGYTTSIVATYDAAMPEISIPSAQLAYSFGGYYTAKNGQGTKYYNANGTSARNWDHTSDETLYAYWIPFSGNLAFDANGGSGTAPTPPTVCTYESCIVPENTYTAPDGYRFAGWSYESDSQGYMEVAPGENIGFEFVNYFMNGRTITLSAVWVPICYEIELEYGAVGNLHYSSIYKSAAVKDQLYADVHCNVPLTTAHFEEMDPNPADGIANGTLLEFRNEDGDVCLTNGGGGQLVYDECRVTGDTGWYAVYRCAPGYTANGDTVVADDECVANVYTITLNMNGGNANGTPGQIYEKPNDGWYDEHLTQTIDNIGRLPIKDKSVFNGFFTEQNGTGTQVIASDGRIIAPNFLFNSDATIYAYYTKCECTPGDGVSICNIRGTADNACVYEVACEYSQGGYEGYNGYSVSGKPGVAEYTATCKKSGVTTGYTCPADSTRYISCYTGKYMATMDASGNYVYNGTPTVNNSCQNCPSDAAYCQGGTDAPLYKVTFDDNGGTNNGLTLLYGGVDKKYRLYPGADVWASVAADLLPTHDGKTFNGYWTQSQGGEQYIDANGNFLKGPSANIGLYAQWSQCPAGTFVQDGVCVTCPKGSYCANGIKNSCSEGTYADKEGMSECTACPSNSSSEAGASYCTCNDGYMMVDGACVEPEFTITTTDMAAESTFSFEISAKGTFYVDFDDGRGVQKIEKPNTTKTPYSSAAYANAGTHTIKMYGDATGYAVADAAISFSGNTNIVTLGGSLGAIFGGSARSYMFDSTFRGCTSLQSIPETLFSGVTGSAIYMFYYTFQDCTSLQSIPENLFSGVTGSAGGMFSSTFRGCTSLQSIPETLFSGVTGSANSMFNYTFQGCKSLQSIPETLFSGVTGSADSMFSSTFGGCTSLQSIPETLFSGVTGSADRMFHATFISCESLQSIPETLFSGVTGSADSMFYATFQGCESLQSIPETLFSGVTGSADSMFNATFSGCKSLQSIPETLFSGVTGSANYMFNSTFRACISLTSLPNGLFKNIEGKPLSGMFDSTFYYCPKLTGYIPANTFEKMDSTDFDSATMSGIFTYTALDTQCPAGMYQYITGFESAWNGKVSCVPCPSNSNSEAGATECTCNTGYNYDGGTTTTTEACVVNQYTVTFDANGGTGSMANQTFTYGVAQNLTANAFTRTGYTFNGWNTAANGSGTSYADGTTENLTDENGATVTLYAQWTANTLTLNYYDGNTLLGTQTCTYGQTCTAGDGITTPTKPGYTLNLWHEEGWGPYTPGAELDLSKYISNGNATYEMYAHWTQSLYSCDPGYYWNGTQCVKCTDFEYYCPGVTDAVYGTEKGKVDCPAITNQYGAFNIGLGAWYWDDRFSEVKDSADACVATYMYSSKHIPGVTDDDIEADWNPNSEVNKKGVAFVTCAWNSETQLYTKNCTGSANICNAGYYSTHLYPDDLDNFQVEDIVFSTDTLDDFVDQFCMPVGSGYYSPSAGFDDGVQVFANSVKRYQCPVSTDGRLVESPEGADGASDCYVTCPTSIDIDNGTTTVIDETPNYPSYTCKYNAECDTGYHVNNQGTAAPSCSINTYTVDMYGNGGYIDGYISYVTQERTYNDGVKLTANTFTRGGYTFAGWNTSADGSGTSYADGTTENLTDENNVTITLYAQWSQCAAGTYSANGTCVTCPKGSYCVNGIKNSCSEGTYADKEGMTECTACPAGSNLYKGALYVLGGNNGATSVDSCMAISYYMPEYMVEILGFTVDEAKEQYGYDPNADANKRGAMSATCYYDASTQQYTKNCMGIIAMCSGGYYTNVKIDPEGDQPLFETDTLSEMLDTYCMPVGTGYWSSGLPHTDFDNLTEEELEEELAATWGRHACPTGLTTIGYGAGADEAGDCGRVLHVYGKKLYLRSTEKTDVSLHVKVDGVTFFGNMVVGDRKISAGADKTLKIKHNGQIYSVYDDSVN